MSLLELALVLGIITILTMASVGALNAVRSRTNFGAVSTNVVSEIRRARIQAMNRGRYTAFIINTNTTGTNALSWWAIQTDSAFLTNFASSGFTPSGCVAPCAIISTGTLPGGPNTSFGKTEIASTGYRQVKPTTTGLPLPMVGIPDDPSTSKHCSFCFGTGGQAGWGAVLFQPGGEAKFSSGGNLVGQQFVMVSTRDNVTRAKLVAIVAKNGLIETFEKP